MICYDKIIQYSAKNNQRIEKGERNVNGKVLYEEWFLDISSIFTIYLPTIQFDEQAKCFTVDDTVDGSRYMKEIIGEIKVNYKTKELLVYKMYEIIFERMKKHFEVSGKSISKDRVFVTCIERLFEQMIRNSALQEMYSILLGNVLTPTLRERENIIRNLETLRLLKQLRTLQDYWNLQPDDDAIQKDVKQNNLEEDEQELLSTNTVGSISTEEIEQLEIAIELIQLLEKKEKLNLVRRITSTANHPFIQLYHTESGHYQMVRLAKESQVSIVTNEFQQYSRYNEKLDLYIVENLMSNPKIIYIENLNEKINNGEVIYNPKNKKLIYKKMNQYRIY